MCTYLLICFNSLTALNEAFEANVEFLIFNFVLLHLEPRAGADFGFGASKDRSRPKKARRLRNKGPLARETNLFQITRKLGTISVIEVPRLELFLYQRSEIILKFVSDTR